MKVKTEGKEGAFYEYSGLWSRSHWQHLCRTTPRGRIHVSLLARGERAVSLRAQGIVLENASTGHRTTTQVSIVEHLAPTDSYDVVIVTVRVDQLTSILPILAANHQIPTPVHAQ